MTEASPRPEEVSRLAVLHRYGLLDSEPEESFDGIVRLCAQICETPIAAFGLIDRRRLWFKASIGLGHRELKRDLAFCARDIQSDAPIVIADILADGRFRATSSGLGNANVRSYVGVPVISKDGFRIGTLCVVDSVPRNWHIQQIEAMKLLGKQIEALLELRLSHQKLLDGSFDLRMAELVFAHGTEAMFVTDAENRFISVNPAFTRLTGYDASEVIGQSPRLLKSGLHGGEFYRAMWASLTTNGYWEGEVSNRAKDGSVYVHRLTITVIRSEDGAPYRYIGVCSDFTERNRIEEALKRSERQMQEAERAAGVGYWELDFASGNLVWSRETYRIMEMDPNTFDGSFETFLALVHPDDRDRTRTIFTAAVRSRVPYDTTTRVVMPDGSVKFVRHRAETSYDEAGDPQQSVGSIQDVTLSTLAELSIKESEERFRTIADHAFDWEYWLGTQNEILYMSPSCKRITGYSQTEFVVDAGLIETIVHPDDRQRHDEQVVDAGLNGEGALDIRIVTKSGDVRWVARGFRTVFSRSGGFLGRRVSNHDITDRKNAEEQIRRMAYFDSLTGLPNRRMLMDRLEHGLAQAKRFNRALAIMFLDLDGFKAINDSLGHDYGDELLQHVANRLAACVRSGDTVARQGGDEFVIVLTEIGGSQDASTVAEKIMAALADPIEVRSQLLRVTTSIGIALFPVDGTGDMHELMKKADTAMYRAKSGGRDRCCFFGSANPMAPDGQNGVEKHAVG